MYRLYPSREQGHGLWMMFHGHRDLYNALLEQRRSAWRHQQRRYLSFTDQCQEITRLRAETPCWQKFNAQSMQVTANRVDGAFKSFFRRLRQGEKPGFPRYKSLSRFTGWGYKTHGDGWRFTPDTDHRHRIRNGTLRISGIGEMRARGRMRTYGIPKTCEIVQEDGRWYASITLLCFPWRETTGQAAGIDWGVSTFATVATAHGGVAQIQNPRLLRSAEEALTQAQQILAHKTKGSRNREKARRKVARLHRKVRNQRLDFLHRVTAHLVQHFGFLATEELAVANMTKAAQGTEEVPGTNVRQKAGLNKSILDTAPGMFLSMLRYKAAEAGAELVEVPTRSLKPTQRCARCWETTKKSLSQRIHHCAYCGFTLDRDWNAALVALIYALSGDGREPAACVRLPPSGAGWHETPCRAAYSLTWSGSSPKVEVDSASQFLCQESCTGLAIENYTLGGGDEPLVRRFLLCSCSLSLRG